MYHEMAKINGKNGKKLRKEKKSFVRSTQELKKFNPNVFAM